MLRKRCLTGISQTILACIIFSLGVYLLIARRSTFPLPPSVEGDLVPRPTSHTAPSVVFVCTSRDNTSWIDTDFSFLPETQRVIFIADDPSAPFHPPVNHGNEAVSYLTYLITNYENLAPVTIFLHCHRTSYHNNIRFDNQTAPLIQRLNYPYVQRHGYVNLLCDENGWPSSSCDLANGASFPLSLFRESEQDFKRLLPSRVKRSFVTYMNLILSQVFLDQELPSVIGAPRGAQFALTREVARGVPLETLRWLRQWIMDSAGQLDSHFVGQVLENLWHVIFLGPASGVVCPAEDLCYCELYALCD